MGDKSKIEWTDASWTPIRARTDNVGWHCEHVSEGCRNCYAESINRRLGTGLDFKPGNRMSANVFLDEQMLRSPLKWKKPRRIFVCSMTDLFGDFVKDEWIDRMFAVMALCQQHRFQVLTKRAKRMREYFARALEHQKLGLNPFGITALWTGLHGPEGSLPIWPFPNVWLGVSCEDQERADERIPDLLATPAAVRFVSLEPLLSSVDVSPYLGSWSPLGGISWTIVGGESGPHARPMHPDWARSLRDQCQDAGVPFFMKQMAKKVLIPDELFIREMPT